MIVVIIYARLCPGSGCCDAARTGERERVPASKHQIKTIAGRGTRLFECHPAPINEKIYQKYTASSNLTSEN